jgi:hypothetical protein
VFILQLIWPLPLRQLAAYAADRDSVAIPIPEKCPHCQSPRSLSGHGFYSRFALHQHEVYRIFIRRFLCLSCGITVSLLPWFLLPFFQHCRETILAALWNRFARCCSDTLSRELISFYRYRFLQNLPAIITALRQQGWRDSLPENVHEKAIKVIGRLRTLPSDATANGFATHPKNNFMALLL